MSDKKWAESWGPWLKIESSGPIATSWKPGKNEWTKEAADDLRKMGKDWPHLGKTPMRQMELFNVAP